MKTLNALLRLVAVLFLLFAFAGDGTAAGSAVDSKVVIRLNEHWQFRPVGAEVWCNASVPGCVHGDLLNNKLIEDPFFRLNEKNLQWIGETNWEYRTTFSLSQEMLSKDNIQIVFKGLDTYADVYLNDQLILKTDNMFREWPADIKKLALAGENRLRILFHNVFEVNLPKYQSAPYRLNAFGNNDQADVKISLYSRKAGYEYGWDWGPRLITVGVWRPVVIEAWNSAKLDRLQIVQNSVTKDLASITAVFEISSSKAVEAELGVRVDGKKVCAEKVALNPGNNKVPVRFTIRKPKLWWSHGLGSQPLYAIQGQLMLNGRTVDEDTVKTGIRSLRIVRDRDAIGQALYVELNGIPVFMKGANYIPQDNLLNRVGVDQYEYMVRSAAEANMNMLRVWGGGVYPDDVFYEMCDKYGILVWQDMMFACGMFPSDKEYQENVRREIQDNVKRIRNHPSIALYNGNNENEIAWNSWGWKGEFSEKVQQEYEASLHHLFRVLIPEAIQEVDDTRYYHPTSPCVGYLDKPLGEGDMHYWGVWHGKEPFSEYDHKIARFMSEYGFQSYPDFSTVLKFSVAEDWDIHTPVMQSHQRCMAEERKDTEYGNRLIQQYMDNDYRKAKDFKSFIYLSQIVQADGVKRAIEAHRRHSANKECMGSLYWQIDDCWPVASWSSIDYYGNWKALHYYAKTAYQPVILSAVEENGDYRVYGISDELQGEKLQLVLRIIDMSGKPLKEVQAAVSIAPNTSAVLYSAKSSTLFEGVDKNASFAWISLLRGTTEICSDLKALQPLKDLGLGKPTISVALKPGSASYEMELSTDVVAKNVYVTLIDASGKQVAANFTDNYFDLIPGRVKTIELRPESKKAGIKGKVNVVSLVDTYK